MKRTALLATAVVTIAALGFAFAGPVTAQGPGFQRGGGMYGQGPGMYGQGMGQGGRYMMGPGAGYGRMRGMGYGPGANPDCPRYQASADLDLSVEDVTKTFEDQLAWRNNPNLKLGEVTEKDDDTITVTIVTKDNSLVRQIEVDRDTGRHTPVR